MATRRSEKNVDIMSIWDERQLSRHLSKLHMRLLWRYIMTRTTTIKSIEDIPMNSNAMSISYADEKVVKSAGFKLFTSKIVERIESSDDSTTKLLLELQDGHRIESVIIRHRHYATLCVSSQIGCAMGCKFCATGTMGIIGDLTAGEIIEQFVIANDITKIRNVVFMGMGEPLNNYENVKMAVSFLVDSERYALSPRHVTVSTVGITKNMFRLSSGM
jgi:adenine C2-methylase RlmN of 23S rRNA A2503 and tRNA A37